MHIRHDRHTAVYVLVNRAPVVCGGGPGPTFLLKLYKRVGDYTRDGVGTGERDERAGYFAHDADGAAAVDEVDAVLVEGFAEGSCCREMGRRGTGGGAAAVFTLVCAIG